MLVTLILKSLSHAARSSFVASPIAPPTPTGRDFIISFWPRMSFGRLTNINKYIHGPELFDGLLHGLFAAFFFRNVSLDNYGLTAIEINHALRLLRPVDIVVDQGNFGTLSCEQDRSRTAIANLSCGTISVGSDTMQPKKKCLPARRDPAPVTIATSPVRSNAFGDDISLKERGFRFNDSRIRSHMAHRAHL